jgi:transcriptional regulator with XRE-family HTH domain
MILSSQFTSVYFPYIFFYNGYHRIFSEQQVSTITMSFVLTMPSVPLSFLVLTFPLIQRKNTCRPVFPLIYAKTMAVSTKKRAVLPSSPTNKDKIMKIIDKIFCDKLRNIRNGLRMSQQELADSLGIKRPTLNNYETGVSEPTLGFFRRLRRKYKIDLNWLIMDENSQEQQRAEVLTEPEQEYTAKINSVLLEKLLLFIEIIAAERGMILSPKQKARVLALTYEAFANSREGDAKSFLARAIELDAPEL